MFNMIASYVWLDSTHIKINGRVAVTEETKEILRFELLEDVSFRAKNFAVEAQHWADQVGGTIDPGDGWAASAKKGTVFLGNVRFLKVVRPEAKVTVMLRELGYDTAYSAVPDWAP